MSYDMTVAFDYKIRCDKHAFKPQEYCEMCMIRNQLQQLVEKVSRETQSMVGQTHLAIEVLNKCYYKLEKRISDIEGRIDVLSDEYNSRCI